MTHKRSPIHTYALLAPILGVLLIAYIPLIQRVPNGSEHWFMMDVGEFQVVLNNWGTVHTTGYPLFTILANLFTDLLTAVGVRPLVAAALFSLFWGLIMSALIYALIVRLTARPVVAAGITLAFGLVRTIWIHHVIAEIYTFGMVLLVGMLALALWDRGDMPDTSISHPYRRVYWLALIGGIAVFHHRALVMVAPALLFAVWGDLTQDWRKLPRVLITALGIGLLGFIPYAYLVIRARMGAAWVYGNPDNWQRFWEQFTGAEWGYIIGLPQTFGEIVTNFQQVSAVVVTDMTLPGIALGIIGLIVAAITPRHRRSAITLILSAVVAFGFHVFYYTEILYALTLPANLSLVFGWGFLADEVLTRTHEKPIGRRIARAALGLLLTGFVFIMIRQSAPFIRALVTDPHGLNTIETVRRAPAGSTVMLPWGLRYFAVGYARDIEGDLQHITLVDHKADYREAVTEGSLVTLAYLRYRYPLAWWEEQVGKKVFVEAIGDDLVVLQSVPPQIENIPLYIDSIASQERLICTDTALELHVAWLAPADRSQDQSVFVHLLDANGQLIAQDDQSAPVFGWRPIPTWLPGEIVQDIYTLPRHADADHIRYGLYTQTADGAFVNTIERDVEVACDG